ncbi:dihydrolipoyl dehydrogenase family protein [Crossiella cryophila]|uniref:Pyruvate/2-oxoglutarate dehydrogenase complex dihydrolipoamide dehydrogenase (E3) component n=1 Tax=Crossiella cryophila TaxID=43355 RepID=A0A7W7FX05_9PSEU|nr:NAD(P)/FAD-dependent oxidoreductase [Crossiella cryophila]MBB4680812.1 pyruvate/2-oxoglutarate dehydrogenase complex dihydrolipoamide dehydrogenase (E3) component [Crossiella cryophila]
MSALEVDVVVIGLGPGGEHVATELAGAGLRVLGVERRLVGGECPYYGCIPTKMMVRAAEVVAEARRVPELAGSATVLPDWSAVAERIRREATDNWDDAVAVRRLTDAGATFLRGTARITAPGQVEVLDHDNQPHTITATKAIVLNPGTEPLIPPIPGLAGTPFWTNREAVRTEYVPDTLVVLGGGAIGLEFAQLFARFGAEVHIIEPQDHLAALEEPEAAALLAEIFADEGITVHTGAGAKSVSHQTNEFTLTLTNGTPVTGTHLLVATGRKTDFEALGIGNLGLDPTTRTLPTDDRLKVAEGVWAVGDIVGHGAFTHMSMYQADIVIREILGRPGPAAQYHAIPRVTFTNPELGSVGLTEKQARAQGHNIRTGLTRLEHSSRGFVHKVGNRGLIKLILDTDHNTLLGATAMGPAGGEILGALAMAVHAKIPLETLQQFIGAYPTFHRALSEAVKALA